MILDSGYVILDERTGKYYTPNNTALYRTRKGAQKQCDIESRWRKSLRVVAVDLVVADTEVE